MTDTSKLRRLSDKIIWAHEQACREGRLDVAEILLQAMELDVSVIGGKGSDEQRESTEALERAFQAHEDARAKSASGKG